MIEKLMYMMMYTRSNIAFALKKLIQFINDFFKRHDHEIKTLLKYLRFNLDMLIIYRGENDEIVQLIDYSNANYAFDKNDKKSTMNQVFIFKGEPISWTSKKQRSMFTFIIKTKYIILSKCFRQAI